jgi:hypothetical protein
LDKLWVGNTFVGRKKGRRESPGGIFTSKLPRLRRGIEQLLACSRVNGKVINALVSGASNASKGCCGKHSQNGVIIWFG